ncbi:cleavage and polyadenylation specificity factor subunit 2 [Tremella mesenterica]|uniref:Cleavage and polyadenylation specificity factor subunit 2 n=1 Tax=Tremella mesenterica TaxID=5217 RepID=A0A4Q1BUC6_TREME|nr:cleavage and polyadenylation specificity factor subunit 2 [Tremella mesenterica]
MITLTPLSSSATSSSTSEPLCYLLEVDDARILLDMGQSDYTAASSHSSYEYENKVRELAPTLSLVLLSHSQTRYLSLYPFARARWGLQCPVYATQPTVEMGRVVCLSEVYSWRSEHAVDDTSDHSANHSSGGSPDKGKQPLRGPFVPTVEEVHEAFDWIKAVRYNQPLHLDGELSGLSHLLLTPFRSGHTLGGTLFKIRSPTSGTVLYAVGMNHTGERHLDGMVSEGVLRPDLLIVEGSRATVVNPKRRERETALLDVVSSTLEASRSVLMPVDPSPRLLELLILFDQHWTFKQIPPEKRNHLYVPKEEAERQWPYPLCLVSRTGHDMASFARSLIEWMGGIVREAGGEEVVDDLPTGGKKGRRKPIGLGNSEYGLLDFRHIRFFASPMDLLQGLGLNRPKLVLAIPPAMNHGPSRWLFTAMGSVEENVILLTSTGQDQSLARDLYNEWEKGQSSGCKWGEGKIGKLHRLDGSMTVELNSKVPLIGAELEAHVEAERLEKEREAAHQAALNRSERMLEADDLESDSDSDTESLDAATGGLVRNRAEGANAYAGDGEDVRTMSFDIFVKGQQMRTGRGTEGGMARFRMFPFLERRGRKIDDYGEGLDIGQWVRKGKEIEEEGETEEVREAKRRKEMDEEKHQDAPEPPSKYVTEIKTVELHAYVFFVDMDGQLDGQALKTVITDLQPRKIIIVRSTPQATENLLDYFRSASLITHDIHTPALYQTLRIGEHVQSYSLILGDSISASLAGKWSKFEGFEITMVDGKFAFSAGSTVPHLETSNAVIEPAPKLEIDPSKDDNTTLPDSTQEVQPVTGQELSEDIEMTVKAEPIDPTPQEITQKPTRNVQTAVPLPTSLFVGDLRLAVLKNKLASLNIPAEFAGEGVLVCGPGVNTPETAKAGSLVAVRKVGTGEIVLEGTVGKVYFDVRKALYGSFAMVAAA